jgi:hypothetical protein
MELAGDGVTASENFRRSLEVRGSNEVKMPERPEKSIVN